MGLLTDGLASPFRSGLGAASMAAALPVRRRGANPPTLDELETGLS